MRRLGETPQAQWSLAGPTGSGRSETVERRAKHEDRRKQQDEPSRPVPQSRREAFDSVRGAYIYFPKCLSGEKLNLMNYL